MVRRDYGEFKILVDGTVVIDGGSAAFLGVLPSRRKILTAVLRKANLVSNVRPLRLRLPAPAMKIPSHHLRTDCGR